MAQASIINYPPERHFLPWGTGGSFSAHLLVAGLIVLIAFLTHIKTIEELMLQGGSIAQNGPAPEEQMEVLLRPDDLPPPPPTVNPEFIRPIELPKPAPPPLPLAKPIPKPRPVILAKPRFTAPKATGTGETASVSRLVVGSSGFPQPGYPYAAQVRREAGTVNVSIRFDAGGNAADVEVIGSSGVEILDSTTRTFIEAHWHNDSFAGRSVTVPIEYRLK